MHGMIRQILLLLLGCILLPGCALFKPTETAEVPVILIAADSVAEETAALTQCFSTYAKAMTTKNGKAFASCFSPQHTQNYHDEIRSFDAISRMCDLEMTLQSLTPYYLDQTQAIVEVVLDTHYTYVSHMQTNPPKDFRLTTRFELHKIDGRWIIQRNIKKYTLRQPLPIVSCSVAQ